MDIDADSAIVGAQYADVGGVGNAGAAYVFTRSGTTWTQEQKLTASDAATADHLGTSVAIDTDTAVVGAADADIDAKSNQGAAYVFTRSGTTWTQRAKLTASDGAAGDKFGYTADLDSGTAVVGAYTADIAANTDQGAAYVFTGSAANWTQRQKLVASDGAASDMFGSSASISGTTIAVGAHGADIGANANQGAAYTYDYA